MTTGQHVTIDPKRLAELRTLTLTNGSHTTRAEGMCAIEAVAWLAGEEHSDAPSCADVSIRAMLIRFNDRCGGGDDADARRTRVLRPLLPLVVGTAGSAELAQRRSWAGVDWSWRTAMPRLIRLTSLGEEWGPRLSALPEIVDATSLSHAHGVVWSLRAAAWNARDTARARYCGAAEAEAAVAAVAEAAEAAVAVAEEEAVAVADPRLVAIAQGVIDEGGDYWAARNAVSKHLRKSVGSGLHPRFASLREELDAEFAALITRLCAMTEAASPELERQVAWTDR